MMIADALNSHGYPVRTRMTGTKKIPVSHICSTYESESKEFLVDRTLSLVCFTDKEKQKGIIIDESYMEESESECVHKTLTNKKTQRMR